MDSPRQGLQPCDEIESHGEIVTDMNDVWNLLSNQCGQNLWRWDLDIDAFKKLPR